MSADVAVRIRSGTEGIRSSGRHIACLLLALGACSSMTAHAADAPEVLLYRYVDSRGVTVLDRQGVPPEYAGKGYEVLNARGRVVQVVPPPPTAEQLQQAEASKLQASADAQLLHLYSSVEDVDRTKARKFAELDSLIALAQSNAQGLAKQQAVLQGQAADLERAGKPVVQSLIDQMNNLRDQQQNIKADIARYQAARTQADTAFSRDRARIQKLLAQ